MPALRMLGAVLAVAAALSLAPAADEKAPPKPSREEELLLDLTNKARSQEKLPPLKVNALLTKAAAGHSANMARHSKMDHELDGKRVPQRLDDIGYDWDHCGENIGVLYDLKDGPKKLFDNWMKSKVHRDNILNARFAEIGLVIVKHPKKDEWYVTQVFGTANK